jgi:hypothetical protein
MEKIELEYTVRKEWKYTGLEHGVKRKWIGKLAGKDNFCGVLGFASSMDVLAY